MHIEIQDTYRFDLVRKIASGGMGSVYEAVQYGAFGYQKRVAIKTLLPKLSKNQKFIDMFIGEGKLVATLVHENIVQMYQLAESELGLHIVMEYVHGLAIRDFIGYHAATKVKLPTELAVFIASRIARGLAYAHSRLDENGLPLKIVHRDVCPNNVLITTEGLPKLTDFGIAKAANDVIPLSERDLVGKIYYMSPEQARREPVDFRSDMYSLGLLLFELLTTKNPRIRDNGDPLTNAQDGWLDWDLLPEDLPEELRIILARLLAPEPADRYESSDQVGHNLEYYIYHKGYGPTVVTLESYLREHFTYLSNPKVNAIRAQRCSTEAAQEVTHTVTAVGT
ncbi:MAG: serine/threonine protein kinase [Lentisphaeria bacterium]|nr:serine/threonine protein kinase [Lentisphaeria bacterium]